MAWIDDLEVMFFSMIDLFLQGDHTILFQMPEILLFDMFVPQRWGVGTDGVYPARIRWVIVLLKEKMKK